MTVKDQCVLGISPGTRIVGLAVIQDGELVEWKVKSFKEAWSSEKRKAILTAVKQLCDDYKIRVMTIKKIDPLRSSPELDRLVRNLVKQAKRHDIKVYPLSLSDLDYNVRTGKQQTKSEIITHVAANHPEVQQQLIKEQSNRNNRREYYTKMFEAIAMAELIR